MKLNRCNFFITSKCNFACLTCYGGFKRGDDLSFDLFKKIISEVKLLGIKTLMFTGGEPCLNKDFKKIVELVVKNGFRFSFVTNGSILEDYKFIVRQYRQHVERVNFSLDGADKQIHDAIRQKGSFIKVIKSIKYFQLKKIPIGVFVCLNKINFKQINNILRFTDKVKIKHIDFGSAVENKLNSRIVLTDKEKKACVHEILRLKKKYPRQTITINSALQGLNRVDSCIRLKKLLTATITPQGNLIFCTCVRPEKVLGSLRQKSYTELFNKYKQLVFLIRKIRQELIAKKTIPSNFNNCEFCNYIVRRL